jgi:uncharacterized protein with von Willebrand factor type A (vWA) domain
VEGLPPIPPPPPGDWDRRLVLVPRYPVSERAVAQAWRRLRRPVRTGPAGELDVAATVARRSRTGVVSPPVLVPRRRNSARLLLLVDVGGSMRPYQDLAEHVCGAIRRAGRLDRLDVAYFHNLPAPSADRMLLDELPDPFGRRVDQILRRIRHLDDGRVYADPRLREPGSLATLLDGLDGHTAAAVVSDAGAARGHFDSVRLIDSIALLKAVRNRCGTPVWLNPAPQERWARTTAEQIRRHVPMYPLARKDGLDQAVGVLRGRPATVEVPL